MRAAGFAATGISHRCLNGVKALERFNHGIRSLILTRHYSTAAASSPDRQAHAALQAEVFASQVEAIQESITPEVEANLARVADAVPDLGPESRVLDAGAGEGALIPHLQRRGVKDILAVDICPAMLTALEQRCGRSRTLGNEPGVRTWCGDVADLPSYMGPFTAAFFNAVFGNLWDQNEALLRTCFLLKPGSHIVISHPLGRQWHEEFRGDNAAVVPHPLPTEAALQEMIEPLPLQMVRYEESPQLYLALLKVPDGYAHPSAPLYLSGDVTTGFGRGSKQLGVPTANLPPAPLAAQLAKMTSGVYFGWAQVDAGADAPAADSTVHKMVMNVGRRPTFEDADPELSVEVHVMHSYQSDFYGKRMRVVVLGHLRPEVRFGGLQELLERIRTDIGIARAQLDEPMWAEYKNDPCFK